MILANSDNPQEGSLLSVEAVLIVSVACAKKLGLLEHVINFVRMQALALNPLTGASQNVAEAYTGVRSHRPKEANRSAGSQNGHEGDSAEDVLTHGGYPSVLENERAARYGGCQPVTIRRKTGRLPFVYLAIVTLTISARTGGRNDRVVGLAFIAAIVV
jgi:hypothetical protein